MNKLREKRKWMYKREILVGGKGNDLQGRHRVFNKAYASRNEYFLRNKLVNKHEK